MAHNITTIFVGRTGTPSIPTTYVGTDIPTKLVGTVYFDKSCIILGTYQYWHCRGKPVVSAPLGGYYYTKYHCKL